MPDSANPKNISARRHWMRKYYKYNRETLMYEEKVEPMFLRIGRIVLCVVLVLGLVWIYHWFYTSVIGWELPKTAMLRKEMVRWESKMDVISRQLDFYEITLKGIEDRDDRVYRSIFGLDSIRTVSEPVPGDLLGRMDSLALRTVLRSESMEEIKPLAKSAGNMVAHVPAIPPICPVPGSFRLSSGFGGRIDPVYGGGEFHQGQDIACSKGTPVYLTGDGVVELVDFKFTGYGNEVVVNHGFGYKTRYAHLSSISVSEGMELKRGDIIGRVGRSGKSTGPHLHYEVIYKGKRVNPMSFMDIDMPVPEFREMVSKRQVEAKYTDDRMPTTMEILRRRERK